MRRSLSWLAIALGVPALALPALADTIQLKNGRRIEGKILAESARSVRIEVDGGSIELPIDQIEDMRASLSPLDELAERMLATDLGDPAAVERLATWARGKGLEERAQHLHELARGVRLDQRFELAAAEAQSEPDPAIYLALARWTRENGYSSSVQRLALENARKLAPKSVAVAHALLQLEADERAAADEQRATTRDLASRERELAERERALAEREQAEREREEGGYPGGDTGILVIRRGGRRPCPCPSPSPAPSSSSPRAKAR